MLLLQVVSVAENAGLSLASSKIPNRDFGASRPTHSPSRPRLLRGFYTRSYAGIKSCFVYCRLHVTFTCLINGTGSQKLPLTRILLILIFTCI